MLSPLIPAALMPETPKVVGLNQILRAIRTHLGMEVSFISEFADGRRMFRAVDSAEGRACIEVGGSDPLEESYCHWVATGKLPRLIRDPAEHAFTAELTATASAPVGAHLSVPIRLRDGQIYGTFCCFSFQPDQSLTQRDLATLEAFAQIATDQIQYEIDSGQLRETKVSRIKSVLRAGDVHMVYQPVFRLDGSQVEFVEALARFPSKPYHAPDRWFEMAAEVGLGQELQLLAIRAALEGFCEVPRQMAISVNVAPETILSSEFAAVLANAPLRRLIVEISEHETVGCYSRLNAALEPARKQGLRVAIDDMGAGYSSLRHILQIRPDMIKLDISLSSDIQHDPARRALASALVSFAREIGCELIAEGIESEGDLSTVKALGINRAQGFLLGRPLAIAEQEELLREGSYPVSHGRTSSAA
jgi:EAL domain-containing protein (putative c-di-GMP-specific phosphodiesterase class I)